MKTKKILFFGLIICITFVFISGAVLWDDKQNIPTEMTSNSSYKSPILWIILPIVDYDGNIYLLWYNIENATGYEIYHSKDEGEYVCIGFEHGSPVHTLIYKDIVLSSGKYDYKIKAIYIDGESNFSNIERVYVNL